MLKRAALIKKDKLQANIELIHIFACITTFIYNQINTVYNYMTSIYMFLLTN